MREYQNTRILFTSVGRRVELIQAFHSAADKLNQNLKIFGTDITDTAPALHFCDETRIIGKISDPDYIAQLLRICEKESIDCLIPTIDTDLMILAENKKRFEAVGTKVLVPEPDKVKICRDKNYTTDYFKSLGLKSPVSVNSVEKFELEFNNGNIAFPVIIKPKDGSSSIDAYKVEGIEELKVCADKIKDYIIQPCIVGREYTIDIFCDYEGNPVFITPRERLAIRSGEVLKTKITQDDTIIMEALALISDFKPCGQITVQLIREDETGDDYYIEINPRFGGGAPLSIKAGADSAMAVIQMLNGEKLQYIRKAARDGEIYSRFDQSICINEIEEEFECKAVIFDLDDTLFSEKEYIHSGYNAVAEILPQVVDAEGKLWAAFSSGKKAIDAVLQDEGIYNPELAEKCLSVYRSHIPNIHLYDGVQDLFYKLRDQDIKIGIITDGRPEGQRNKIKALGLNQLVDEIIITDELGGSEFRKPDDISFRIMQKRLNVPFESMVYVGDNLSKDFDAPQKLKMKSVWLKNTDSIYYDEDQISEVKQINSLEELIAIITETEINGYK